MRSARTLALLLAAAPATARADPPVPAASAAPAAPADAPDVVAARAANLAAYEKAKTSLASRSWVVFARGKLAATGADLDAVRSVDRDAAHRFVFRVGDEGDREEFISTWYAARFAGLPFMAALHAGSEHDPNGEVTLIRGSERSKPSVGGVFPRVRVSIATADGRPAPPPGTKTPEVFVGTVGPELMLTPDDAARLRLAQWEVPGTLSFFQGNLPCRRVLVRVAVEGLSGDAVIVGAYPTVARGDLVDWQRHRDMFWQWGAGGFLVTAALDGVPQPRWIMFGNDRILGHGSTPEEAVLAADPNTEFAYHRFLMRVPDEMEPAFTPVGEQRPAPRAFDLRMATKTAVTLNGRAVPALALVTAEPTFVVSAADAAAIGLELAEAPWRAQLVESDDPKAPVRYARAGRAWDDRGKPGVPRRLVLVLYERPKTDADDPFAWEKLGPPAMK